jgi:methyltransferase-like protein/trans-aconitate methyltransferase
MDTYDTLPYQSTPFTQTHPENLAVLGFLHGVPTADPRACRVLELGCAAGGNLIPLAWYLPDSHFLGIEASATQAGDGQALIRDLGIANVEIRQHDILQLEADLGEFDFIIVHGVFSWVPHAVQEKILSICRENLAPNGIAYISYNTLPGWRMRGMLRDMLLHHTRNLDSPTDKVEAAREFLTALKPALAGLDAYSAKYVHYEAEHLLAAHPSYLFHEYLASINQPLLFSEFAARARSYRLQYLCDLDLQSMFPSALGDKVVAFVEGIGDVIEREQYLDFVRNRNFRQTLLCHDVQKVDRNLRLEKLDALAFASNLSPPKKLDFRRVKEAPFSASDGTRYPVRHPLVRAALLYLLSVYPNAVKFDVLFAHAQKLVASNGDPRYANDLYDLRGELFSLYAHHAIGIAMGAQHIARTVPERPCASGLARSQAAAGLDHLATARHETIRVDAFTRRLVSYLDGAQIKDELIARLASDIISGHLEVDSASDQSEEKLKARIAGSCERLLSVFARHGLLTQPSRDVHPSV